jgi:hypothetical protein
MLAVTMSFHPQIAAVQAADEPEILTPPPAPQPRINGARVFGVRPGHPVLYTIAASGRRPMKFSVANLPDGLQVNHETGQITGSLIKRGTCRVMLRAENAMGHAERELRIVVGDELLWSTLGRKGKQQVRDLWRQKDLGVHAEKFTAEVRPHGVVLVRLTPAAVSENASSD